MRLILQCSVCGTNHGVGAEVCGTCRAAGLANLRLLFECTRCFTVGLRPSCIVCNPPPVVPPFEVIPDPVDPEELARRWGVSDAEETETALDLPELPCEPPEPLELPADDFELKLEEELPEAEEEVLRLDDEPGPAADGK